MVTHAIEQSQITVPGAHPFHLKARVFEATNRDNDAYNAEIEEYWAAPDKWRRTIKSSDFSQTLIVNGDNVSEDNSGDYYPNWLRTVVSAIFDPGAAVKGVDMSKSDDNPVYGTPKFCRRFAFRAGIPPIGNNVFLTYCFERGLLDSVFKPGYHAEYQNYRKLGEKQVARKIREYLEPGTEVGADIEELTELQRIDESLFSSAQATPRLETVMVSEATVRGMAIDPPALQWPPIHGGKSAGVLSIYVCLDRTGHVREIYELNSDHPEMADAARQQVMKWQFKPAVSNGVGVQVESILTFAYETKMVR